MTPEQAVVLRDYFVQTIEQEAKTTRRVLQAVPGKGNDYRPDPKSRTGLELAWHIAASDSWFLDGMLTGSFNPETEQSGKIPANVKSGADVAAFYDKNYVAKIAPLKKLSGEQLAKMTDLFGALQFPLVAFISMLNSHSIHHRGQLTAYLRAMGAKVPDIYGGSADEPFQMGAGA